MVERHGAFKDSRVGVFWGVVCILGLGHMSCRTCVSWQWHYGLHWAVLMVNFGSSPGYAGSKLESMAPCISHKLPVFLRGSVGGRLK